MITRGQEARRREKQGLGKSVKGDDEVRRPLFKWFWQLNTVHRLYSVRPVSGNYPSLVPGREERRTNKYFISSLLLITIEIRSLKIEQQLHPRT